MRYEYIPVICVKLKGGGSSSGRYTGPIGIVRRSGATVSGGSAGSGGVGIGIDQNIYV